MNWMQRRRGLMMAVKKKSPILPPEYQQVEWIGKTNTNKDNNPMIKVAHCGYFLVGDTITAKLKQTNIGTKCKAIGGEYDPGWGDPGASGAWTLGYQASGSFYTTGQCDGSNYIYGSPFDIGTITKNSAQSKLIEIGATQQYGPFFEGHIGEIVWERSGNIVADLIPCYRIADGEVGMYDIVNDKFCVKHINSTGAFIKGADV